MTFMLYLIDKAFEAYVWYTCLDVIGLFVLYIHMVFDACIYIFINIQRILYCKTKILSKHTLQKH